MNTAFKTIGSTSTLTARLHKGTSTNRLNYEDHTTVQLALETALGNGTIAKGSEDAVATLRIMKDMESNDLPLDRVFFALPKSVKRYIAR